MPHGGMSVTKVDTAQLSDKEAAQRRDEIVRVMVNTPAQPRIAKQPFKARRKATPAVSGRKAPSADSATGS